MARVGTPRVCFAIQAHTDAVQCERLVRALCSEGDTVLLHIDRRRASYRAALMRRLGWVDGDIRVIGEQDSVPVYWSGFTQVEASLRCLGEFLALQPQCEWFSLHSGQDYPVQPVAAYRAWLQQQPTALLMESEDAGCYAWRCQAYNFFRDSSFNRQPWFRLLDKALREAQKPFVRRHPELAVKRGSCWFAVHRDVAAQLVEQSTPQWRALWRYSACADEHYFQTLAAQHALPVGEPAPRYIDFSAGGSSPRTLRLGDLPRLQRSGAFFARKFESQTSAALLHALGAQPAGDTVQVSRRLHADGMHEVSQ